MKRPILTGTLAMLLTTCFTLAANAVPTTFTNQQLMNLNDLGWGAADSVLHSKTDLGDLGVEYHVTLGTADYGKLSLGFEPNPALNLSEATLFHLKVEVLTASGGSEQIELNPFLNPNWNWYEGKDEAMIGAGQTHVQTWDISGIPNLQSINRYGFQLFQAGGIENPAETMEVVLRVSPILTSFDPAQQQTAAVPEPASAMLLGLGAFMLMQRRARRSHA